MWVIFILAGVVIALVATLVITLAAWIIHKVSNAMIRENRELEREEEEHGWVTVQGADAVVADDK